MKVITSKNICKHYKTGFLGRKTQTALNNVSFSVNSNEVFGIIGLNGAGKSTLLKILLGFISPNSGTTKIYNPSSNNKNQEVVKLGYLPEHPSLYPHLTIREHLHFGCKIAGLNQIDANSLIDEKLKKVDLLEVSKLPIKQFSKGMTQRAALAYAILLNPEILIFDEPMSGLDPLGRQLVIDIIEEYKDKGTTILFCSHILTDVERICDRTGIMHKGSLINTIRTTNLPSLINQTEGSMTDKTPLEQFFLNSITTELQ